MSSTPHAQDLPPTPCAIHPPRWAWPSRQLPHYALTAAVLRPPLPQAPASGAGTRPQALAA